MKKIVAMIMALLMVFALCGCGEGAQKTPIDGFDNTTTYDEIAKKI